MEIIRCKDKFCICIVAIWLRPSNRLRFGALGLKCQIYSTMARSLTNAKKSGYVPRKVAEEIKKRATEREKKAKEKETKDVSAKWQGACVPGPTSGMAMRRAQCAPGTTGIGAHRRSCSSGCDLVTKTF